MLTKTQESVLAFHYTEKRGGTLAILKRVFLLCLLSSALVSSVSAQDRIHIWVKAFIPNSHPGNPGYVKPVPAQPGRWVISAPVGSDCYMTDNRTFSGDPNASARMTTEFTFTVDNGSATTGPAGPKPIFATGPTHDVNCATGADLLQPRTAATADMHMGHAAFADGIGQVVIDCRAGNPFFVFLPGTPISFPYAPDIRYGGTFTYDTAKETLRFQGSTGVFPAFEAYAQLNDGAVQTLFRLDPGPGTTVISLTAAGTGLNQQPVDVSITFPDQYRAFDQVLGKILQYVDRNTYLFIISDHGIKPLREFEESRRLYHSAHDHGGNTPIIAKHDFEDGDDVPGIFIAMGPSIKRDVRLMGFTVSVFDIAPTILNLYGIPEPPQMKGRVLSEIFEAPSSQPAEPRAR
jgi:hypothetical protein